MDKYKDVTGFLKEIRSIRKFNSIPVDQEILEDIVDCARLAPNAKNIQPWEFIAITNKDKLKKLANFHKSANFLEGASAAIVVFCDKEATEYFLEDGCAATQTILIAANLHGLKSCWIAGAKGLYQEEDIAWCEGVPCKPMPKYVEDAENLNKTLNVPLNYALISMVALGYSDEKPEVKKRSLEDVIHWQEF
ncbi:nitroreductase family protein [Natronincola peptidivorans]|uniref:nitroreductase family protein n=1 Tax=Natronincola peptidivorans TaxID=426128 RepID=UPI0014815ABA|nr:nitroreductase family protein [Natronincola peptidivorans]